MEQNITDIAIFAFVIIALIVIIQTYKKIKRKRSQKNAATQSDWYVEETPQEIADRISGG